MASHNYHQGPSAPPMYPDVGGNSRPIPPVRLEYQQSAPEENLLPPTPPIRMDDPSARRTVESGLRRNDQERTTGDVNVEATCNYNSYATKKTIAMVLLLVAIITSNAMQLRTLILQKQHDRIWTASLVLVSISIVIQFGLSFLLYLLIKSDIRNAAKETKLRRLNDLSLILVVLIVLMNVVINIFMLTTNPKSFLDTRSLEILQQAQTQ